MAGILIIGTVAAGGLQRTALEVASVGHELATALNVPLFGGLIGSRCQQATDAFVTAGMSTLFVVDDPRLEHYTAESHIAAAMSIVQQCEPTVILVGHTLDTGEWVPQLAAELAASAFVDCHSIQVDADHQITVHKAVCGGAIQAEYAVSGSALVATVAAGMYAAESRTVCGTVSQLSLPRFEERVCVVEEIIDPLASGPALKEARIVVAGGLGVGGRDQWPLVTDAATALGAAVGATRAVVEAGWAPASQQVGYSGNRISPDLYIAIGISGAVHHLVGISQAKAVVAINTDPNADIFRVSRFGVVGDAKAVVPAFIERARVLRETNE
jgi:electron transfer flavoprotein alpha subunit